MVKRSVDNGVITGSSPVEIIKCGLVWSLWKNRDFSLMVKYETLNLCDVGSNPTDLNEVILVFNN